MSDLLEQLAATNAALRGQASDIARLPLMQQPAAAREIVMALLDVQADLIEALRAARDGGDELADDPDEPEGAS